VSGLVDIHDTIEVYFNTVNKNSFTLFAWMTDFEGNMFWVGNDTIWGRAHSNGRIHINGSPVFMKKATTSKAFDPPKVGTGTNKAIFKDGYETGIAPIAFPTDISELITAGSGGGRKYVGDVHITLSPGSSANNDGMVYVRSGNLSTGPIIDSIDLSNPGFNGAVVSTGRMNVEGTLDGKLSLGSQTNIYVQDNIYYERNPRVGSSDDLLGLVAEQNVIVADNAANRNDCEIYGNVFTRTGSLFAENVSGLPICGKLVVFGSVVQKDRGEVGTYAGGNLKTGFAKSFRYDERLADGTFMPPFYPGYYVSTYAITNWWESYRIMDFD
jgi:hypothetical protein